MSNSSEPSFFQQALELYEQGKYLEGYTLVTEHAAESPAYLQKSFYFRLCLSAKSGDLTLAEKILEDALDQGYFFSEYALRKEDDLKELQERPFFERLVNRDLAMLEAAQKSTRPLLKIISPEQKFRQLQVPFHMTLHGNSSNLNAYLSEWSFISRTKWLTAMPQSSQLGGTGIYVWNDQSVAMRELKMHYDTMLKHHHPDPQKTLISGFSMGGHAALRAALNQVFPITAFLLICPYFDDPDSWRPLIEKAAGTPLKGHFLLGELDELCTSNARGMQKLLKESGIACEVEIFTGMRHEFPPDFERVFEHVSETLIPS